MIQESRRVTGPLIIYFVIIFLTGRLKQAYGRPQADFFPLWQTFRQQSIRASASPAYLPNTGRLGYSVADTWTFSGSKQSASRILPNQIDLMAANPI